MNSEPCSWCGDDVDPDDGFRAYEPAGGRRAVFCRIEHIVPWVIQGSGWGALVWEPLGASLMVQQVYDHQSNMTPGNLPLLVIDGDSFAHRAYHGVPKTVRRAGSIEYATVGSTNRSAAW